MKKTNFRTAMILSIRCDFGVDTQIGPDPVSSFLCNSGSNNRQSS